jgi:hypothetical protein
MNLDTIINNEFDLQDNVFTPENEFFFDYFLEEDEENGQEEI